MSKTHAPKLSICIGTYNRADFIGATLQSIVSQVTDDCEIVISDNASSDSTKQVVAEYASRCEGLRYVRQGENNGLDRNFDCAVRLARGEYCWLMTDDDLMKPGAIARVLSALRRDFSLLVVNIEFRDFSMSKLLQSTSLDFNTDRIYGQGEMDRLFVEVHQDLVMYVGGVVIKREIWLARESQKFYGSYFIHVGIIYQQHLPSEVLVIADPLISYRMGNTHSYSQRMAELFFVTWPLLVESLAVSPWARQKVARAEPWRNPSWLLLLRGWGYYSRIEYQRWVRPRLNSIHGRLMPFLIALLPGVLVNAMLLVYYAGRSDRGRWVQIMKQSRYYLLNRRALKH